MEEELPIAGNRRLNFHFYLLLIHLKVDKFLSWLAKRKFFYKYRNYLFLVGMYSAIVNANAQCIIII